MKLLRLFLNRNYGDLERVKKAVNHSSEAVTLIYAMADAQLEAKYRRRRARSGRKKS